MKNVNNTVFWDSLPWTCFFNNFFVVKSLHFLMILNSLTTILGLSKSGGWLNKLLRTAEIWFCFPLHFHEILWIALVSRWERVGGGAGRSKIIRTIEWFFWVNSIKQLSAGDYFYCATYPGLVLWFAHSGHTIVCKVSSI